MFDGVHYEIPPLCFINEPILRTAGKENRSEGGGHLHVFEVGYQNQPSQYIRAYIYSYCLGVQKRAKSEKKGMFQLVFVDKIFEGNGRTLRNSMQKCV